jgi:hypothetical protein
MQNSIRISDDSNGYPDIRISVDIPTFYASSNTLTLHQRHSSLTVTALVFSEIHYLSFKHQFDKAELKTWFIGIAMFVF